MRIVRMPFKQHRGGGRSASTVTSLQWPMYGANSRRTQAHGGIKLRPPFRAVWVAGTRDAARVPRRGHRRRRLHRQLRGHDPRDEHARTARWLWRHDPPGGKMASSPCDRRRRPRRSRHGRRRPRARPGNGPPRWSFHVGSPIESSPSSAGGVDYFGAWNGRVYALDLRRKLRWTGAAATRSRPAPRSPARSSTSATTAAGCSRSPRTGRLRFSRGERPRLRDAGDRCRARLRPLLDGGSLTAFTTAVATCGGCRTGGYVYSSPAVWAGRVFFGSYNGRLYSVSAKSGGCSGASAPAGRCPARRSLSAAWPTRARRGAASPASTRRAAASSSASRTASTCPSRATAAACSCTGTRGVWAVEPKA